MSLLYRRRGNDLTLPTTSAPSIPYYESSSSSALSSPTTAQPPHSAIPWIRSRVVDGSARSIRLYDNKSLQQLWREAQLATKITYILTTLFLLMAYFGVRSLRYHHAHINLNCHMTDCTITIRPLGWKRKASVTIPRRQLTSTLAVKTTYNGTYVSSNPSLHENYNPRHHNKKHHKKVPVSSSITYKGPDENGHYVSYALLLKDHGADPNSTKEEDGDLVDLAPIRDYLQQRHTMTNTDSDDDLWCLTFHLFGISHAKRRVRTMMTRIDSYVKRRRQNVTVKEASNPSWVGILCVVFGLLGLFLTLLLGQYVDEKPPQSLGPGARRNAAAGVHHKTARTSLTAPYQRTTPARYEVRMQPATVNVQKQY